MSSTDSGSSSGLRRSGSKGDLLAGVSRSSGNLAGQSSTSGSGLKRTTSRPNLLGSQTNLSKMGQFDNSSSNNGGLGLRRTGSKMSLADVSKSPSPSLEEPGNRQSKLNSEIDSSSAISDSKDSTMSPPMGAPRLHRSRSMNFFESMKAPPITEGQLAVEQISGKVELPSSTLGSNFNQHRKSQSEDLPDVESPQLNPKDKPVDSSSSSRVATDMAAAAAAVAAAIPTRSLAPGNVTNPSSTSTSTSTSVSSSSSSPSPSPSSQNATNSLAHYRPGPSPLDDAAVRPEAGSRVDYFSHDWNESDIAGSWRYIISRRQGMANSARLENASWRMWAKAKYNLKTVDPSTVNWLKDYDVTWLYGPLYHEPDSDYTTDESHNSSMVGTPEILPSDSSMESHDHHVTLQIPGHHTSSRRRSAIVSLRDSRSRSSGTHPGCHPKSILKKKSLAQLMLEDAQELDNITHTQPRSPSSSRSTANYIRHHRYRPTPQGHSRQMVATILNKQYNTSQRPAPNDVASSGRSEGLSPHSSSNSLAGKVSAILGRSPSASPGSSRQGSTSSSRTGSQISFRTRQGSLLSLRSGSFASLGERRVHFNDRVEQCIALDPEEPEVSSNAADPSSTTDSGAPSSSSGSFDRLVEDVDDDDDDEDDDDDDDDDDDEDSGGGLFLGLRRPSMLDIKDGDEKPHIIAALPATTLKFNDSDSDSSSEEEHKIMESMSVSSSRRPGFNAQYAPSPVQNFEIVDPEIHPVKFEAKGVRPDSELKTKVQPTASFG